MRSFFARYKKLSDNNKIVVSNVAGAFVVKGFALFVTLYTLPAYIAFFNNSEVLGLWFTILSLLNWILNFDLGIGNGLRNKLATALTHKDNNLIRHYISSAYFSVGMIVILISCAFPLLLYNANLNESLNISQSILSPHALNISIIIVLIGVMLQFWFRLISSVLYALQKSSINNFLVLCTNILILLYAKFAPSGSNDSNVIAMSIVHGVAVLLPLLIASLWVFGGTLKFAIPRWKFVTQKYVREVLGLGGIFFFIQITYMIIMSTNEYLITITASNSDNIEYQAYYKLFSLGSTVFALMLTPVWSVVTKAKAENNYAWIKQTYHRFLKVGGLFCLAEFLLIIFIKPLMNFWLGNGYIEISIPYCIYFAVFGSLMVFISILSSIANGVGRLKSQAVCFGLGAVLKVPLAILLVHISGSWIGVLISNIVCMGIYCIAEPLIMRGYLNNQIDKIKIAHI